MNILHNNPVHRLLVSAVDSRSFDELGLDTTNGIWLVVCVEVDGECVDHFEEGCNTTRSVETNDLGEFERGASKDVLLLRIESFQTDRRRVHIEG